MRNAILIAILCTMAGCALESPKGLAVWHYRHQPAQSEAMNVALAAGLADGSSGVLHDLDHGNERISYGQTAPAAAASGNDAAIDMETGLLGDGRLTDEQSTPHIYAFMPGQDAGNGYAAAAKLQRMVSKAMARALSLQGFQAQAADPEADGSFAISGGACAEHGIRCTGDTDFSYMPTNMLTKSRWDGGIRVAEGPDFVGGGPVWFFKGYAGIGAARDVAHRQSEADNGQVRLADIGLDMARLYRDMSRALPAWVYVYDPDDGGAPAMFTAGRTLRFTAPVAHAQAKEAVRHRS